MEHNLIPLVAIVMVFLVPLSGIALGMIIAYLNYQKRREMFALYHQERMAAIDKGIDLPPLPDHFFRENGAGPRRVGHHTLLAGLILLFVGVTLSVALHVGIRLESGDANPTVFGLIPAGVGVAFLIYYFTVGRKVALALEAERKAKMAESTAP